MDTATLRISITEGLVSADVVGDAVAFVEIAEILGWIGAACRSSLNVEKAAYCYPRLAISREGLVKDGKVNYVISKVDDGAELPSAKMRSNCWDQVFLNPVIVVGWPIAPRYDNERGVEMSFDMLITLSCVRNTPTPHTPDYEQEFADRLVGQFMHTDSGKPGRERAHKILLDSHNRNIVVYKGSAPGQQGERHECDFKFEDIVTQMFEVLTEMQSHQDKIREAPKWDLPSVKSPFTANLEGFDFADILSMQRPLRPRFAELSFSGPSWLKVTAKSGAINILGSGFGELVQPKSKCVRCQEIPQGFNLLAAPAALLKVIADRNGEVHDESLELVEGIFWNGPHLGFGSEHCRCEPLSAEGICAKPITELASRRETCLKGKRKQIVENIFLRCPTAAVIIGRESDLRAASKALKRQAEDDESTLAYHDRRGHAWDSGIDVDSSAPSASPMSQSTTSSGSAPAN
ncbi:hypothetical protein LTR85_005942 [Meristemomyces frigidus]|nr:hypothetical protein LTR85_005942 [Meristemomyces frigidus]